MKQETQDHLRRRHELLRTAQILLQNGLVADCVSRCYYAMFRAATAALFEVEIERRSHKGVLSAFSLFLIKPGHLDQRFHAYLRKGFDARSESDYWGIPSGTEQAARDMLANATEFVEACEQFCLKPPR